MSNLMCDGIFCLCFFFSIRVISPFLHIAAALVYACVILTSHGDCNPHPPLSGLNSGDQGHGATRLAAASCLCRCPLRHLPPFPAGHMHVHGDTLEHMYSAIFAPLAER